MNTLEALKIDLKGLRDDITKMSFSLDNEYFTAIDESDIRNGNVGVDLTIHKVGDSGFELIFHITGSIVVPCDRCLDDMEQDIAADGRIVAKFGEEYSEDDEYVTVPEDEGILDTTWLIYEFIALNIPIQHVHTPGKCNRAMTEMLEEMSAARSSEGGKEKPIDPRWSELEKLRNK